MNNDDDDDDKNQCEMPDFLQRMYGVKKYGDSEAPSPIQKITSTDRPAPDRYRTGINLGEFFQKYFVDSQRQKLLTPLTQGFIEPVTLMRFKYETR